MSDKLRPSSSVRHDEMLLASRVARMHFIDGKTNQAIAGEFNISRFRVARLINLAVAEGLVKISVSTPASVDDELSNRLAAEYGLRDALVVAGGGNKIPPEDSVGRLAAEYLTQLIEPGSVLGVTWGRSTAAVARAFSQVERLQPCEVVQMIGGMPTLEFSLQSTELVRQFAEHSQDGVPWLLHAPLVVGSRETALTLRQEPSVALTLTKLQRLDFALVGVGSWNPQISRLIDCLPAADVESLRQLGVAADVCTTLFDAHGKVLQTEFNERTISATWHDLKSARSVVAVAHGEPKLKAIKAALDARFIHTLVTDGATARYLIEAAGRDHLATDAAQSRPRARRSSTPAGTGEGQVG